MLSIKAELSFVKKNLYDLCDFFAFLMRPKSVTELRFFFIQLELYERF